MTVQELVEALMGMSPEKEVVLCTGPQGSDSHIEAVHEGEEYVIIFD